MRKKIIENLKDGLNSYLGKDSSFEDTKVEQVEGNYPGIVGVNRFIGIDIDDVKPRDREIGAFGSLIKDYTCGIILLVKGADYVKLNTEIDTIVHRILRYLSTDIGDLNGIEDNVDSDIERVVTYKVSGINYGVGKIKKGGLGHLCTITVTITTETHFV